jgi:hypothetical protein
MPARRLINDLFIQYICSQSVEVERLLKSGLPTFVVLFCFSKLRLALRHCITTSRLSQNGESLGHLHEQVDIYTSPDL